MKLVILDIKFSFSSDESNVKKSSEYYAHNFSLCAAISLYFKWTNWYEVFDREVYFFTVCSYHVTNAFQSESTLYSCLNVKEFLSRNRCEV